MTKEQLIQNVCVERMGQGQYQVTIWYRNKKYTCTSNDSQAWDDHNWDPGDGPHHYTSKQALQRFWNECCMKNHIGKYSSLR